MGRRVLGFSDYRRRSVGFLVKNRGSGRWSRRGKIWRFCMARFVLRLRLGEGEIIRIQQVFGVSKNTLKRF